jgi:hypothetical protein
MNKNVGRKEITIPLIEQYLGWRSLPYLVVECYHLCLLYIFCMKVSIDDVFPMC